MPGVHDMGQDAMTLQERFDAQAAELKQAGEEIARLKTDLRVEDVSHANTVDQRDRAEAAADWLAQAIMGITGQDIGEHSSANCPWHNGIAMAEEYAGEREKLKAKISRLKEALDQALIHWGAQGVTPEDSSAYAECEKRLEESAEEALASVSRN